MEEPLAGPMNTGHRANIQNQKAKPEYKNKSHTYCSVSGCQSRRGNGSKVHFHHFPPNNSNIKVFLTNSFGEKETIDKRQAWERVLCMGKQFGRPVTKYLLVCSRHFKDEDYCARGKHIDLSQAKLKRFAVPSQNLPKMSFTKKHCKSSLREKKVSVRQKLNEKNCSQMPLYGTPTEEHDYIEEEPVSFDDLTNGDKIVATPLPEINKQSTEDGSLNWPTDSEKIAVTALLKMNGQNSEDYPMISSIIEKTECVSRYSRHCSVPGCQSKEIKHSGIHLHNFPPKNSGILVKVINSLGQVATIDMRKAWEKVILMKKPASDTMRVCSRHFRKEDYICYGITDSKFTRLKQIAIPSQNLPKNRFMKKQQQSSDYEDEKLNKDQNLSGILLFKTATADDSTIENKATSFKDLTNEKVADVDTSSQMNDQSNEIVGGLKKGNWCLKKEQKVEDLDSFPEKLVHEVRSNIDGSAEDFGEEETLEDVKNERNELEQQLKRLEDDYQWLMDNRIQDLTSSQKSYGSLMQYHVAKVTSLKQKRDKQQESILVLQKQLEVMKEQSAVVKEERDRLRYTLLHNTYSVSKNSGDLEVEEYLLRKMSYLEKQYEKCESGLRAMILEIVEGLVANDSCDQCAKSRQQLIDLKVELEQLLDTFITYNYTEGLESLNNFEFVP